MSIFPSARRFAPITSIAAALIAGVALFAPNASANPWVVTSTDGSNGTAAALFNATAGGSSLSESGGTSSPFTRSSFSGGQSSGGASAAGSGGLSGGLATGQWAANGTTTSVGSGGAPTSAFNFTGVGSQAGALTLGNSSAETITGGTATAQVTSNRVQIPFIGGGNVVVGEALTVTGSSSAAVAGPGAGLAVTGGSSTATSTTGGN